MLRSRSLRRTAFASAVCVAAAATAIYLIPYSQARDDATALYEFTDNRPMPAGKLIIDAETNLPAVAPLTMNFVRTPDNSGPDGKGRYLIAVNSGFGIQINTRSKAMQTLSVIDLLSKPDPKVIQNVYFPSPQSANVGLVFDSRKQHDGTYRLFLAGGFENKIWMLGFDENRPLPLSPSNKPDAKFDSPFVDVSVFAENAPTPNYNDNVAAVYPTGIALSPDGNILYSANNLADNLGIIRDLRDGRKVSRIDLRPTRSTQFVYPYDVVLKTSASRVSR